MSFAAGSSAPRPDSQRNHPLGDCADWDAAVYDRVSGPQAGWAQDLLARLALKPGESVLDAGCGSGRVTAQLADAVDAPDAGRVYAVDAAPSMVAHARAALGERAVVLQQDLVELSLPEPVDAVFSGATFHWIAEHQRLFARLYAALRPGGRLVAQCGGAGNIDVFRRRADSVAHEEPFGHMFEGWRGPWNYAGAEVTAERMAAAGFIEVETWLEDKPVTLEDPKSFVRTVCLVRHLDRIPPEMHDLFIDRVLARTGFPLTLDYVRLNMTARRA